MTSSLASADRWSGSSDSDATAPTGPPGAGGGFKAGKRVLQLGQKVLVSGCQANPLSCLCPPDAIKVKFYESSSLGGLSSYKLMCVSPCLTGQLIRRRQDAFSGLVSYNCESPPTQDKTGFFQ